MAGDGRYGPRPICARPSLGGTRPAGDDHTRKIHQDAYESHRLEQKWDLSGFINVLTINRGCSDYLYLLRLNEITVYPTYAPRPVRR